MERSVSKRKFVGAFDWQGFRYLITALVAGGLFLAACLGIEWGVIALARATIDSGNTIIDRFFDAIALGSSVAAVVLFVLHSVVVIVHYAAWQKEDLV